MAKHRIGLASEIPVGKAKKYVIQEAAITVFNVGGTFYAIQDICSHKGASLAETGTIEGAVVTCGWHGAEFDVMSGKSLSPFATDITKYSVVQEGNELFVEM